MAALLDVCRFFPTTGSTTDWTVSTAVLGYQTPASAGAVDAVVYRYRAESADLTQWEIGYGAYTVSGTVLARTTVLFNSLGTTAKVNFTTTPQVAIVGLAEDFREKLDAARTYYVRTDGSDSNSGLVNSAGGAFLTTAKAMTAAGMIDCSSFQLTISVQAGTYTAAVALPRVLSSLPPILTGVGSTTIISVTGGPNAITNNGGTPWQVTNLKVTASTNGQGLQTNNGGVIQFSGVEFGACQYHILAGGYSSITATGAYSISAAAQYHMIANGVIDVSTQTVTITGTPAFSGAYASANRSGTIIAYGMTFSGTATGSRYAANGNGVIDTVGGGATYFPGNAVGTTATGGQYL